MKATDIMTEDPMTAQVTARVREVIDILHTLEIRHLPILQEDGTMIGMISDRDLRNLPTGPEGAGIMDAPITTLMTGDVISASPESDVEELVDIMLENKVGAVPVLDDETSDLVGIVSYVDILRSVRGLLRNA